MKVLEVVRSAHRDRRLIFIGDIHGCYDELTSLLHKVQPGGEDVVVSVGDVIRKGPQPMRCLDFWRDRGYLAVLGNHEAKALREHHLGPDHMKYIRTWPVVIDFPDEEATAVHGGLLPGMRITEKAIERHREELIKVRWIRKDDGLWTMVRKGDEKKGDVPWWEVWDGDRTVVYGHTPRPRPQIDKKAIGIDTGCVYGGRLTAAIFEGGSWTTESVRAKHAYAKAEAPLVQVVKRLWKAR